MARSKDEELIRMRCACTVNESISAYSYIIPLLLKQEYDGI